MLATIAVLVLAGFAPDGPSKEELAAITARGRALAGYDRAAMGANDAVLALNPPGRDIPRQVARRTEKGWVVAFGRLDKGGDQFLVTYEAAEAGAPDRFTAARVDPPRASTGYELRAALAMDAALADFLRDDRSRRPYNLAALPAGGGKFWVYVVPAPTRPGTWPLGGDARYLVAPDGATILERRRLHDAIVDVTPGPAAGSHAHTLSDLPEDTDVLHVLSREPRSAERVTTPHRAFTIKEDGSIEPAARSVP